MTSLFQRLAKTFSNSAVKHTYANPEFFPEARRQVKKHKVKKQYACVPGTIVYHDWLVRELGYDRRLADGYEYAYLNGYKVDMPMPKNSVAE